MFHHHNTFCPKLSIYNLGKFNENKFQMKKITDNGNIQEAIEGMKVQFCQVSHDHKYQENNYCLILRRVTQKIGWNNMEKPKHDHYNVLLNFDLL